MQDFLSLCQSRRSIRKYTDTPIAAASMDKILRCALMAPSGKRVNPWEFYVTTDVEKIRPMSMCRTYGSQMFQTATGAIVVCADASLTDVWMADCAIAAEHILLAATEENLGACWCQVYGRFVDEENTRPAEQLVKEVMGIPEHLTVLCVISLGHKDEERRAYDLDKLLYQKIHTV